MTDAANPKTPKEFDEYLEVVVNTVNGNYMVCHEFYEEAKKKIEKLQQEICTLKEDIQECCKDKNKAEEEMEEIKKKLISYKGLFCMDFSFLGAPSE